MSFVAKVFLTQIRNGVLELKDVPNPWHDEVEAALERE